MSGIKVRVLHVDDNVDSCLMMKVILDLIGHSVTTAGSVAEGLEAAQETRFSLFMLDGRLPDGSGTELRQRLRELYPNTPALFFTGLDYTPKEVQALEQQGDGSLQKPATPIEIQAAVQKLL